MFLRVAPAGVDRPTQKPKQILLQHQAYVLDVISGECRIAPEALGDVALGSASQCGDLRAANPVARHGQPYLIRNGTRKWAGRWLAS